jgi:hypothetical protein
MMPIKHRFLDYDDKQKTIKQQEKADKKAYPRCMPWRHVWVNKDVAGLASPQFLDQCERCSWWKVWGTTGYESWHSYHAPSRFIPIAETPAPIPWWKRRV